MAGAPGELDTYEGGVGAFFPSVPLLRWGARLPRVCTFCLVVNVSERMRWERGGGGDTALGLGRWRKAVGPAPPLPWDTLWVGTQE